MNVGSNPNHEGVPAAVSAASSRGSNLMIRLLTLATLLGVSSTGLASAQEPNKVMEAVEAGMNCKQSSIGHDLECDYHVGRDLHFAIAGVGQSDAGISFFKVDWDGDYYAGVGVQHGCVVVQEGKRLLDKEGTILPDYAFVSPVTGKVYGTWQECGGAR